RCLQHFTARRLERNGGAANQILTAVKRFIEVRVAIDDAGNIRAGRWALLAAAVGGIKEPAFLMIKDIAARRPERVNCGSADKIDLVIAKRDLHRAQTVGLRAGAGGEAQGLLIVNDL